MPTSHTTPEKAAELARAARQGTLIEIVDQTSRFVSRLTGTEKNDLQLNRLAITVGTFASLTVLFSIIPDRNLASFLSNGIAGLGGAFAGDTWTPVSRWFYDARRKLQELEGTTGVLTPTDVAPLLSRFPNVLSRTELRQGTMKPERLDETNPRERALQFVVTKMSQGIGELSKEEQQMRRREIRAFWREAETIAQQMRANPEEIKKEGALRSLDVLVGIATAYFLAVLLDSLLHGHALGGFAGLGDDIANLGLIGASGLKRGADVGSQSLRAPARSQRFQVYLGSNGIQGSQRMPDMRVHLANQGVRTRRI